MYSPVALDTLIAELNGTGLQAVSHAIGDGAVRMALDAYENAIKIGDVRGRRFRVEHIELVDQTELGRFKELGVIASVQSLHCCPDRSDPWTKNLGAGRRGRSFAWRQLLNSGARLAFGSDWPVASGEEPCTKKGRPPSSKR